MLALPIIINMNSNKILPKDIKIEFFKFLSGEKPVNDFEGWVYAKSDLEAILGQEDYLNLISLDFSKTSNKYEIGKILERHINIGEFETWNLKNLLTKFISQSEDLDLMLYQFYNLCSRRFHFLSELGIDYGLILFYRSSEEYQPKLTDLEKKKLLDSLVPGAREEAKKVLNWLDEGKIIITSEKDEFGYYIYIDNRT